MYPTLEEVETASHRQICIWWRFLNSPGMSRIDFDDFKETLDKEVLIMNKIGEKLKEYGGFTPEISKSIGW